MYKYEISAQTAQELNLKVVELANTILVKQKQDENNVIPMSPTIPAAPVARSVSSSAAVATLAPAPSEDEEVEIEEEDAQETGSQTDSRGLPWDARIHAASRALNKDKSWRNKRGLDDKFIQTVEQELIAKMKSGEIVTEDPVLPVPQMPVSLVVPPPPAPTIPVEMPSFQAPPVVEMPVTVAPVAQAYENIAPVGEQRPAYNLSSFKNNLTVLLAKLVDEGKIDQNYINELKKYFNVKEIWNVMGDEKKCTELYNTFGELGFITRMD